MSASKIKAIKFEVQQVGKKIKGTKRRYLWALSIGQRVYNFILDDSLLSGKSKLTINGRLFHEDEQSIGGCNYNHTFIIDGCLFNISYANDFYQMKINNNNFSHFLGLERKKNEFQEHKVDQKSFDSVEFIKPVCQKKITINLPGMGNAMKKKKPATVQSDNWASFCEAELFNPFTSEQKMSSPNIQKQIIKSEIIEETKNVAEESKDIVNNADFHTMQDLFKTICLNKPYEQKIKEGETPTYQIQQIPALPQINLQEFSTIHQLFATKSPIKTLKTQKISEVKSSQFPTMQQQKKLEDDFNTMRHIFQTLNMDYLEKITTCNEPSSAQINIIQLNTMQQLFLNQAPKSAQINANEFNNMQDLFADKVDVKKENEPKRSQRIQSSAFNEFNTIQCVFDTKNMNKFTTLTQDLALTSSNKVNNTKVEIKVQMSGNLEKPTQIQNPKWDDFNTMQNIFKTNVQFKKQNQFWKF